VLLPQQRPLQTRTCVRCRECARCNAHPRTKKWDRGDVPPKACFKDEILTSSFHLHCPCPLISLVPSASTPIPICIQLIPSHPCSVHCLARPTPPLLPSHLVLSPHASIPPYPQELSDKSEAAQAQLKELDRQARQARMGLDVALMALGIDKDAMERDPEAAAAAASTVYNGRMFKVSHFVPDSNTMCNQRWLDLSVVTGGPDSLQSFANRNAACTSHGRNVLQG